MSQGHPSDQYGLFKKKKSEVKKILTLGTGNECIKPGTDLHQGCCGAMRSADLIMYIVSYAEINCAPIQMSGSAASLWWTNNQWIKSPTTLEADRAVPHNLCVCPHLRSAPHTGCLSVKCCASVFPALHATSTGFLLLLTSTSGADTREGGRDFIFISCLIRINPRNACFIKGKLCYVKASFIFFSKSTCQKLKYCPLHPKILVKLRHYWPPRSTVNHSFLCCRGSSLVAP